MSDAVGSTLQGALRRFKRYEAYTDSGVEWLGEIPVGWEVKRLKEVAALQMSNVDKKSVEGEESVELCNYTDVYYRDRITPDIDFMKATATREQIRRFALRAGDVLITKDSESWTDIAVPAVVTEDLPKVLCGYHLALIRPHNRVHGPYLVRAISAVGLRDQFRVAANGVTRFAIGTSEISTSVFAIPPIAEQRAVAAFLDRETARIDALVAKKERLVALLQERRTGLITRVVTRGLNPAVPMRDTGVDWLGQIPAHWSARRVKEISRLVTKGTTPTSIGKSFTDEGVRFVKVESIGSNFKIVHDQCAFISSVTHALLARSRLAEGDVLVSIAGAIGRTAVVERGLLPANTNQAVGIVRVSKGVLPSWIAYALSADSTQEQFGLDQVQSAQANLSLGNLAATWIALPPIDEQVAISAFLDRESSRFDHMITGIHKAIELLNELRTALISAAVTGKIDVREAIA